MFLKLQYTLAGITETTVRLTSGGTTQDCKIIIKNHIKYDENDNFDFFQNKFGFYIKEILTDKENKIPIGIIFESKYLTDSPKNRKTTKSKDLITDDNNTRNKLIQIEDFSEIIDINAISSNFSDEDGYLKDKQLNQYWNGSLKDYCIKNIFDNLNENDIIELLVNIYDENLEHEIYQNTMFCSQCIRYQDIIYSEFKDSIKNIIDYGKMLDNLSIRTTIDKNIPDNTKEIFTDKIVKIIESSEYYKNMLSGYENQIMEYKKIVQQLKEIPAIKLLLTAQ